MGIKGCRVKRVIGEENNIIVEVEGRIGASWCPRSNPREIKGYGKARARRVFHIDDSEMMTIYLVSSMATLIDKEPRTGGRERLPEIDTIVLASDRRPNIFLAEVAERKGIETRIIGDAKGVTGADQGTVLAAIAMGYEVGRQI